MPIVRIAHITDLHIARPPTPGEYNIKRLLGYINYRLFRSRLYREHIARNALTRLMENPPDLVLLTGDITQHGLNAEFDAAAELLSPLLNLDIPVIAVPGNHDMYGPASAKRLGALIKTLLLDLKPDEQGLFRFPGVEILPLSQGVQTPPFLSYGRQNSGELRRAREVWAEPANETMRLACGHFPVIDSHGGTFMSIRGLRDPEKLIEFCHTHSVSGYFCGHNHKRYLSPMPGGCVQYAAPALSSVKNVETEWISVYRCEAGFKHPKDETERS